MEIDAGATLSVISHKTLLDHWGDPGPVLRKTGDKLKTYTGETIPVEGTLDIVVEDRHGHQHTLPLLVVPGERPSLLGRNWLVKVPIDWPQIHVIASDHSPALDTVLGKHEGIFKESKQVSDTDMARFLVGESVQPRFFRTRNLPYMMRVIEELDRLPN